MKTNIIRIGLLSFLLIVLASCNRQKTPPPHARCDQDIQKISKLLENRTKEHSKADLRRIRNLVKAASIQQQHGDFVTCIDKTNRALTLLKTNRKNVKKSRKN